MKEIIRKISNIHISGKLPDVLLFSVPRSGSTWVMQLIASQKGFKICDEPLNLRKNKIRQHLGIDNWIDLYKEANYPAIEKYFQQISKGKLGIHNISPLHKQYRFLTRRIAYKILHGCEWQHKKLTESLNARNVFLIRHPIAVALSRKELPRLSAFLESDFANHFSKDQLNKAKDLIENGSNLEKGILSWCFQIAPFFAKTSGVDIVISYEQMVLNPDPVIELLMQRLLLENEEKIRSLLGRPSGSTFQCDQETKQILKSGSKEIREVYLVTKWFGKVDEKQKQRAQELLNLFNISVYRADTFLPHSNIWIGENSGELEKLEYQIKSKVQ